MNISWNLPGDINFNTKYYICFHLTHAFLIKHKYIFIFLLSNVLNLYFAIFLMVLCLYPFTCLNLFLSMFFLFITPPSHTFASCLLYHLPFLITPSFYNCIFYTLFFTLSISACVFPWFLYPSIFLSFYHLYLYIHTPLYPSVSAYLKNLDFYNPLSFSLCVSLLSFSVSHNASICQSLHHNISFNTFRSLSFYLSFYISQ